MPSRRKKEHRLKTSVRNFLKKPMYECTVGDHILMNVYNATIFALVPIVIGVTFHTLGFILQKAIDNERE